MSFENTCFQIKESFPADFQASIFGHVHGCHFIWTQSCIKHDCFGFPFSSQLPFKQIKRKLLYGNTLYWQERLYRIHHATFSFMRWLEIHVQDYQFWPTSQSAFANGHHQYSIYMQDIRVFRRRYIRIKNNGLTTPGTDCLGLTYGFNIIMQAPGGCL